MKKNNNNDNNNDTKILEKAKILAKYLYDKKATNIVILDVRGKSDITDFFVLATGNTYIHVNSLSNYAKKAMMDEKLSPLRREGVAKESRWSVIDFGAIILHIFTDDLRLEYNLENVWGDASKVAWEVE